MNVFAYLRVSTDAQDVANQRHGVDVYCRSRSFDPAYVEDTSSGKTDWRDRRLGGLIAGASAGDQVVVSEVSRLARTTLQVLEIVRACIEKKITLHIVKAGMVIDDSMQSKITVTLMGLLAELERDLISSRTREALQKRKAAGVKLGRAAGVRLKRVKLDQHRKNILRMVGRGESLRSIATKFECSPNTVRSWLKRRGIGGVAPDGDNDCEESAQLDASASR